MRVVSVRYPTDPGFPLGPRSKDAVLSVLGYHRLCRDVDSALMFIHLSPFM
jgi:hypothetical protein